MTIRILGAIAAVIVIAVIIWQAQRAPDRGSRGQPAPHALDQSQ